MRLQTPPTMPLRRTLASLCAASLCLLLVLALPLRAEAQGEKKIKPVEPGKLKLRLKRALNSGNMRIGDYVEFEVVEDVNVTPVGGGDKEKIISKGTPAFGRVLDRRRRFTFLKEGAFAVGGVETTAVDGQNIKLTISRPTLGEDLKKSPEEKRKETRCPDKTRKKGERGDDLSCVRGRAYRGGVVANLPSAVLAVVTATILTRIKDDNTGAVVGVTLVDKVVSQPNLGNLINGVDAVMENGEIFDAVTNFAEGQEIKLPGTKEDKHRICRFGNVPLVPEGYIVADYYSDLVGCRNLPGEQKIYTGKVIERYTDKPAGATLNLCEGPVPAGWVAIARKSDPGVCPREPGDPARDPHYNVILKTP